MKYLHFIAFVLLNRKKAVRGVLIKVAERTKAAAEVEIKGVLRMHQSLRTQVAAKKAEKNKNTF